MVNKWEQKNALIFEGVLLYKNPSSIFTILRNLG